MSDGAGEIAALGSGVSGWAEGDRVIVRARTKARHEAEFLGIPATLREVNFPFVVGYEIQDKKIVHSWLIPDYLTLMEQLKGKDKLTN